MKTIRILICTIACLAFMNVEAGKIEDLLDKKLDLLDVQELKQHENALRGELNNKDLGSSLKKSLEERLQEVVRKYNLLKPGTLQEFNLPKSKKGTSSDFLEAAKKVLQAGESYLLTEKTEDYVTPEGEKYFITEGGREILVFRDNLSVFIDELEKLDAKLEKICFALKQFVKNPLIENVRFTQNQSILQRRESLEKELFFSAKNLNEEQFRLLARVVNMVIKVDQKEAPLHQFPEQQGPGKL